MIRINKWLSIVILLCFFLPFAEGCHSLFGDFSAEEKAALEKARQDSILAVDLARHDSTFIPDTTAAESDASVSSAVDNNNESAKKTIDSTKEEDHRFRQFMGDLLLPEGNYSGILLVVIGWRDIAGLTSLIPAFIILIILIFMSGKKAAERTKRIFILSAAQFFFMLMFLVYTFDELMYGYWITLFLSLINTVIAYMNYRSRKKIKADLP